MISSCWRRSIGLMVILLVVLGAARSDVTEARRSTAHAQVGPSLPAVTVAGDQLLVDGQPFEVRGVNYIDYTGAPPGCPELHFGADGRCPWDQALIDADMVRLQTLGVNTIRIFLNYYVFGGARITSQAYDQAPAMAHLDALIASANRHGIYVLPVLLAKFPQDQLHGGQYEAAAALHIRPVVSHLAGRSGLLGWDLFNEPDIGSPMDQRCWDWDNGDFPLCRELAWHRVVFLARMSADVRAFDPGRPITIGMGFGKSYFRPAGLYASPADLVDFYSFHYYDNDPYDSGRYAQHWYYGAGFPTDLRRALVELRNLPQQKPIVVTELGFPTGPGTLRNEEELRRDLRIGLATSRATGAAGVMLWPFQPTPDALVGDLFIAN